MDLPMLLKGRAHEQTQTLPQTGNCTSGGEEGGRPGKRLVDPIEGIFEENRPGGRDTVTQATVLQGTPSNTI